MEEGYTAKGTKDAKKYKAMLNARAIKPLWGFPFALFAPFAVFILTNRSCPAPPP
jgi:hypothetical protein